MAKRRPLTDETKQKISVALTGKPRSDATKAKIKAGQARYWRAVKKALEAARAAA